MGGYDNSYDFVLSAGNPHATAAAAAAAANAETVRGARNSSRTRGAGTDIVDIAGFPNSSVGKPDVKSADPMKVEISGLSPALEASPKQVVAAKAAPSRKKKPPQAGQMEQDVSHWDVDPAMYGKQYGMYPPGMPPYGYYPNQMQMPPAMPHMYPPNMNMNMWRPATWGPMGMYPGMGMQSGFAPMGYSGAAPPAGTASGSRAKSSRRRRRANAKGGALEPEPAPAAVAEAEAVEIPGALLKELWSHGEDCHLTLADIMPHLHEFSQDRQGYKYFTSKLELAQPEEKEKVFEVLLPKVPELAMHIYGYLTVEKLFDVGDQSQRKRLVDQLATRLLKLANEPHGCRVIQHAIQNASRDSQLLIAAKLKDSVSECIQSMHGNHVIQKCIEQMPPESVGFIIDAIEGHTEKMASHAYGCRVIQRLLEHCAFQQLQRILDQILVIIPKLATHRFGNYVVQHILEHGRKEDKKKIIYIIREKIVDFAKGRCSSIVVEKCFEIATVGEHAAVLEEERAELMRTVLGEVGDPNAPVKQMMDDKFGQYVVQRVAEHSRPPEKEILEKQVLESLLRNAPNGNNILAALSKDPKGQAAAAPST